MTVKELMETLESCNPDAEVRIATQSSYPFQNSVAGAVDGNLIVEYALDNREYDGDPDETPDAFAAELLGDFNGPVDLDTVYIVEGSQLGYFTKQAWNAI